MNVFLVVAFCLLALWAGVALWREVESGHYEHLMLSQPPAPSVARLRPRGVTHPPRGPYDWARGDDPWLRV